MKSKARIGQHPIHPMLVAVPLGLWAFSFITDLLYLINQESAFLVVSAYSIAGGIAGALAAAVPGFIDYTGLKDPHTRRIANWHMGFNLFLVALYCINFWVRLARDYEMAGLPFVLSIAGVIFLILSGWLGGELVYIHRVGVVEEDEEKRAACRV